LFVNPGGIQIYHILVDNEQKAAEVINKVKQGGDFAALAKEYSIDTGSKDSGGDVGLVNEDTNFVPEFKQAALALKPGQISPQPIKTEYGYHIIKAGAKKSNTQMSFQEVKDQLKRQLENDQKDKIFNTYLENLRNNADVKDLR
jgi:peptidyl-prolyl cis-trans isomerase C/foldase protein PrsA